MYLTEGNAATWRHAATEDDPFGQPPTLWGNFEVLACFTNGHPSTLSHPILGSWDALSQEDTGQLLASLGLLTCTHRDTLSL